MKKQNDERVIKTFFSNWAPYFDKPREAIMRHYPKEPRKVIDEMVESYVHDICSALAMVFQVENVHAQQDESGDVMFSFIAAEDWITPYRVKSVMWLATRNFDFEDERMFAYMHVESAGHGDE